MVPRLARGLAVAAGLLGLAGGPTAHAYTWYRAADGAGPPLRWFRTALTYRVSTTGPQELPLDAMPALLDGAFAVWVDLPGCRVPEVAYAGSTEAKARTAPRTLDEPPDNVVAFLQTSAAWRAAGYGATWIAITTLAHDLQTGEVVDADIEVNDGDFRFSAGDGPPDEAHVDLVSTMTHEIGHFFGLDHSLDPHATMFATYARFDDPTGARSLEADDIDGVCALYADVPPHVDVAPASGDDGGCAGGRGGAGLAAAAIACAVSAARGRRRAARG